EVVAGAGRRVERDAVGAAARLRRDRPRAAVERQPAPGRDLQALEFPQIHVAPASIGYDGQVDSIHSLTTNAREQYTSPEKHGSNPGMGRPRKAGRLRMDTDMRIPLTSEQKALIDEATADEPEGKAAWARAILLEAARKRIAKRAGRDAGK